MEVILIENIEKLGKIGDVVNVKDGYARNFLLPKKKVLRANKENLKIYEEKKTVIQQEEKEREKKSLEIAKKIKGSEFIIIRNASENGQLYGSVTSKDIIKEISENKDINLYNEQINLKRPLKSLGVFEIEISVYIGIKEKVLINVSKTIETAKEQMKLFKNPKEAKKLPKKDVKTLKGKKENEKESNNLEKKEENELTTKDMLKEIEKKTEKTEIPEKNDKKSIKKKSIKTKTKKKK